MARKSVYEDTNGVPRAGGKVLHVDVGDGDGTCLPWRASSVRCPWTRSLTPQSAARARAGPGRKTTRLPCRLFICVPGARNAVANRIVSVGHPQRAALIAEHLDDVRFTHASSRGFTTYTGTFEGVEMSVIAIGMGPPMMDFMVREVRNVVQGPMAVVRFGTCGGLREDVAVGTVAVASEGAVMVHRDYDAFMEGSGGGGYRVSGVCPADGELSALLRSELEAELPLVAAGLNVTADSFYAGQGRHDPHFDDRNGSVVEELCAKHPSATSCEMETFQLFHLARCSRAGDSKVRAAAAAIVVANRPTGAVADGSTVKNAERAGGLAALRALRKVAL